LTSRASSRDRLPASICSHAVARAASFRLTLLPATATFWPPAQVSMLACRHQSAAALLPAAASC
jgi:hypothetical protein